MSRTARLCLLALLAPAPLAAQAGAWPVVFNNYCTVGAYRVCASSNVSLSADGRTLTMDVWNNERVDSPTDVDGESATITAVGLYHNPTVTLGLAAPPAFTARYYTTPGAFTDVTAAWKPGDSSIGNLAGVRLDGYTATTTTASGSPRKPKTTTTTTSGTLSTGTQGHKYGIVGCHDPSPGRHNHLGTCIASATRPFVRFTFAFGSDVSPQFVSSGLNVRLHAQDLYDGASVKCDTGVAAGPGACTASATVTPEPATLALLGTGLAGLLGMRRRRRRGEDGEGAA